MAETKIENLELNTKNRSNNLYNSLKGKQKNREGNTKYK